MTPRRLFLAIGLGAGLAIASIAGAQPAASIPRVGFLAVSEPSPVGEAFRRGLRELGLVEDRNVAIYFKWADGRYDRLPELAAELVSLNSDLVVAVGTQATSPPSRRSGRRPSSWSAWTIPSAPGSSRASRGPDGTSPAPPRCPARRSAGRSSSSWRSRPGSRGSRPCGIRRAWPSRRSSGARRRPRRRASACSSSGSRCGIPTTSTGPSRPWWRQRAGALLVLPDPLFTFHRQRIVDLAAKHRLPAMYGQREWVEAGGLAAYAADPTELRPAGRGDRRPDPQGRRARGPARGTAGESSTSS